MSWRKMKFGDFLTRSKIPIVIQDDETYKRVTIKIKHNGVSLRDEEKGSKIGTKKQFILKAGQFIVSKIDARYGAIGIAPDEVEDAIITGNFWAYDVDFSKVNIEWFNQFTNSKDFYDICERASSGITHRKYLNETSFLNNEISLPDIDEQLRIIEEFKSNKIILNKQSTELTHQLDLVKQLRQAFLREAMQGKLVPRDLNDEPASKLLEKIKFEKEQLISNGKLKKQKELLPIKQEDIPFNVPKSWVWCKFGELAYITSGSTPKSTAFVDEGIPYLKMHNLRNQKIDFFYKPQYIKEEVHNGQLKRCRAYPGDIIMNIVGPPLGKIAIIPDTLKECNFNQAAVLIRPFNPKLNKFIFWFLNEMSEINLIETKGVAGQNNISVTQAHNMRIPIPPISEQNRIVSKLDELMKFCDKLEESIKGSQKQNEMLLQQVLREALEPKEKQE